MIFNLAECSIRVTALLEYLDIAIHIVGLHFINVWLLLKFFSATARSFNDDYFNYRSIFISLL